MLDLYCGGGGCSMGYYQAGFDVRGVDHKPQPDYPFKFILMDAIKYLQRYGKYFDVFHASPPCQKYSCSTAPFRKKGKKYADLVDITRKELLKFNKPFIIENVPGSGIKNDIVLSGHMFGLKILKKRHFELGNFFMLQPGIIKPNGTVNNGDFAQVVGKGQLKVTGGKQVKFNKGNVLKTWQYAMGIDWITNTNSLSQAIPPAYTEYIGKLLIEYLNKQ